MKLLMCLDCMSIFNITYNEKSCTCGNTTGKYIDDINVEIKGNCKAIGFANTSFKDAYKLQTLIDNNQNGKQSNCNGEEFIAFFIPKYTKSVNHIG